MDPEFFNARDVVNPSYQGIVVTYAQVTVYSFKHHTIVIVRLMLVVLDEVHHSGDAKNWGDSISEAYGDVGRRLCLTGTSLRSNDAAIPFVRYSPGGDGYSCFIIDYTCGYSDTLADDVVHPAVFLAYPGEARWRDSASDELATRLGTAMSPEKIMRAQHTTFDSKDEWMSSVLQTAHARLSQTRQHILDASGLVIASDMAIARVYKRIFEQITSMPVTLVLSDEPDSSEQTKTFSEFTDERVVAVRMTSGGADVPRLTAGIYATSSSAPLFFAQAIGQFMRSRVPEETVSVFLSLVPVLLGSASQMGVQRNHVLGKPDHSSEGWEDDSVAETDRHKGEPDELLPVCESIDVGAGPNCLIYDGSSYSITTIAGPAEEADYLGLPGFLDAGQMRFLLRQ